MGTWETVLTIAGLALITVITRALFVLPEREIPMPAWLQQGLRYAPLAALVAVIAPEIVMTQGRLIDTWQDPRVFSALAGGAYYFWRRGILGTLVTGSVVLAALRLGLGW